MINKIINIYAVGVCIDKNAKIHKCGRENHKTLFFLFMAIRRLNMESKQKIYACIYANGVPLNG